MRALLEYLGIVEHDHERREPVALPALARWLAPFMLALMIVVLAVVSTSVWLILRSLLF